MDGLTLRAEDLGALTPELLDRVAQGEAVEITRGGWWWRAHAFCPRRSRRAGEKSAKNFVRFAKRPFARAPL